MVLDVTQRKQNKRARLSSFTAHFLCTLNHLISTNLLIVFRTILWTSNCDPLQSAQFGKAKDHLNYYFFTDNVCLLARN